MVETVRDIVFQTDIQGRCLYLNSAWTEITGFSVSEGLGTVFTDYLHPDDRQRNVEALGLLLNQVQDYYRHVVRCRTREGGYRFLEVHGQLLRNENGEPVGTAGTLCDVTERHAAEEALLATRQRLENILASGPAVIYNARPGRTDSATYVSENIVRILGYQPEECLAPEFWSSRIHPEDAARMAAERRALGGVEQARFEYRIRHKNGRYLFVTDDVKILSRAADGRPLEISGCLVDVTDRVEAEQAKARADAILETVRLAAQRFLGTEHWDEEIPGLLYILGRSARARRVAIYEHTRGGNGDLLAVLKHGTMTAANAEPSLAWPEVLSYSAAGLGRIADLLSRGQAVYGSPDKFAPAERAFLERSGVRSVAAVPILSGPAVWGSLVLDCERESWSAAERDALVTAAGIIGAAFHHRQAASRLRWREALLSSMAAATPLGFYVVDDCRGAVLYANRRFHEIWGIDKDADRLPHAAVAAHCLEHVKDQRQFTAIFNPPAEPSQEASEAEIELHDGRSIRVYSTPVRDEAGTSLGRLMVLTDITDWKRAQAELRAAHDSLEVRVEERTAELARANHALRESEELYRTLTETSPDAICMTDPNLQVVMYNRQAMALFGLQDGRDAVGRSVAEFVDSADPGALLDELRERVRREGTVKAELTLRHRNGTAFPAELSAAYVTDANGQCRGYIVISRDVTRRREAEQALQASEKRFRAIFDEAPIGIGLADGEGRLLDGNQRLRAIYGLTQEQFSGLDIRSLIHPDDIQLERDCFHELIDGRRERYMIEQRGFDRQGRTLWVRVAGSAIHVGRESFVIRMVLDMTEQKNLEQQFRHSQKMEAIGRLAGGVAHDFNNLLTVIKGYGELMLRDAEAGSRMHRRMLQVQKASDRAASLVEQLLAFSRKQAMAPKVLHLNSTVMETGGMLKLLVGENIELVTEIDPVAGYLEIDPGQLGQVVMNLAVNARDAMPGGGRLTLSTSLADAAETTFDESGRPYLKLTVSDTGVGMPEEVLSHVFEPFFTTKEVGKGTGLGLSTVYGIVTQAGGRINVASIPGCGTTFSIYFPAVPASAAEQRFAAETAAAAPGQETILVAEDEEMVRSIVCDALRDAGYQVLETCDGQEALEAAESRAGAIHMVLTDMVMPRMNGHELSKRIAKKWPAMKFLYVSGHTEVELAPTDRFLKKPFTPAALLDAVRAILDE